MMEKRDIPESIAALIGPKTDEAAKKASDMASKLDRNNSWWQEPSHVFRAIHGQLSHDRITLVECSRGR